MNAKSLADWQAYLESLNPSKIQLGLQRVQRVFSALDPDISGKIIVVAGTNGKGSTVAALQAMLLSQGATVGAYVSPHLQVFNERICYQGHPVKDDELVKAFEAVERAQSNVPLTYFEFTTLAAIHLLARKNPQYLVFEVGLGGRLDAVNVLDADISIVTGVAMDHMEWLGNDLDSIGYEKAGVYRANKPAIYASPDIPDSVSNKIKDIGAKPYILDHNIFACESVQSTRFSIKLGVAKQSLVVHNPSLPAASALAAVSAFALLGFELDKSIARVLESVSLKGRYQKIELSGTTCVLDVAHNAQAASYLAENLAKDVQIDKPVAMVGTMSDKSLPDIFVPMLGLVSRWFLFRPDTPRASSIEQQRQTLVELGVQAEHIKGMGAINRANIEACLSQIDAAVVFGSFYTVGEFLDAVDK